MFSSFLQLGIEHILDIKGLDHLYFIILISISHEPKQWKKLLWLITAFTVGHSVSLFLLGLGWININSNWIEMMISISILLAAIPNLLPEKKSNYTNTWQYFVVVIFGLIHGLGFSNFFKAIMSPDQSLFITLLGFNIGVEIGQLVIVAATFSLLFISNKILNISNKVFKLVITIPIVVLVLKMMWENFST